MCWQMVLLVHSMLYVGDHDETAKERGRSQPDYTM